MTRRYIFLFYPDIYTVNLDVLEHISDRIFILTSEDVQQVPFSVVKQLQRMGKSIRWVSMESDDQEERRIHLSFLLGKLHEKLPTDIEFAIINNGEEYDGIISFVNRSRRTCMRVSTSDESIGQVAPPSNSSAQPVPKREIMIAMPPREEQPEPIMQEQPVPATIPIYMEKTTIDEGIFSAAARIRERMLRSGNRPAEIELLKEYIILSTPNLQPNTADKVIDILATNKDIEIENREVMYHF
jgi:PIN domain